MRAGSILLLTLLAALPLFSCFKGETGPTGPQGEQGEQGVPGMPGASGRDGISVRTPQLEGMFRVYLKGTELPLTKTDVDSSQYLFLSDTWTFRLYEFNGSSCDQVNQGTVEWGGSTLILTDSSNTSAAFKTSSSSLGRTMESFSSDTLLNCLKCDLRASAGCLGQ